MSMENDGEEAARERVESRSTCCGGGEEGQLKIQGVTVEWHYICLLKFSEQRKITGQVSANRPQRQHSHLDVCKRPFPASRFCSTPNAFIHASNLTIPSLTTLSLNSNNNHILQSDGKCTDEHDHHGHRSPASLVHHTLCGVHPAHRSSINCAVGHLTPHPHPFFLAVAPASLAWGVLAALGHDARAGCSGTVLATH